MAQKDINIASGKPQAPEDVTKSLLDLMAHPCCYLSQLFVLLINNVCPVTSNCTVSS